MMKKVLLILLLGIIFCLTALGVFAFGTFNKISVHSNKPRSNSQTVTPMPKIDHFHNGQPYSLLLLGYGGGKHEGGKLTDSIMLARIIPEKEKVFLISLPRDLWVPLQSNGTASAYWKINAAYAIGSDDRQYPRKPDQFKGPAGGGEMAKDAVSKVTGLPVDNFVALDFYSFTKTIDVLKGVDVKVERTFDDDQYPIEGKETDTCGKSDEELGRIATLSATLREKEFGCRYELLHFDKGITHMDGETALKYVRSRHSLQDGGDFNRAARQRSLIVAVKQKVLSLNFFPKIIPFIGSLGNDIQTDMELTDMEDALHYSNELSNYQIQTIALTDKNILVQTRSSNGQDILAPKAGIENLDSIKDWLKAEMERPASESAAIQLASPAPKIKTATSSTKKK
jgi:anionic cell wall polymer biosynthesis LytR-Cps2A-Psr (LCP) family protein